MSILPLPPLTVRATEPMNPNGCKRELDPLMKGIPWLLSQGTKCDDPADLFQAVFPNHLGRDTEMGEWQYYHPMWAWMVQCNLPHLNILGGFRYGPGGDFASHSTRGDVTQH